MIKPALLIVMVEPFAKAPVFREGNVVFALPIVTLAAMLKTRLTGHVGDPASVYRFRLV